MIMPGSLNGRWRTPAQHGVKASRPPAALEIVRLAIVRLVSCADLLHNAEAVFSVPSSVQTRCSPR
jgi:hypothetical protein